MMPRYMITVTQENAERIENMLGGRIEIVPSYGPLDEVAGGRAVISGLDAITDEEYEAVARRLRTGGPLYHGRPHRHRPPAWSEVLGRDTVATCLAHRRRVTWIPAPDWWIHSDNSTCHAMYDVPAPLVFTCPDGSVYKTSYEAQWLATRQGIHDA